MAALHIWVVVHDAKAYPNRVAHDAGVFGTAQQDRLLNAGTGHRIHAANETEVDRVDVVDDRVGAIRGVRTLFGPANAAGAGARQAVLPLARQQIARSTRDAWRSCRLVGAAIATLGVLTTAAIMAVPDSWGVGLLGENFAPARELAVPYGLFVVATSLVVSSQLVLIASGQLGLLVRSRFVLAVATVVIVAVSAIEWGTRGAIVGAAAAVIVVMPAWARAVKSVLDEPIHTATLKRGNA